MHLQEAIIPSLTVFWAWKKQNNFQQLRYVGEVQLSGFSIVVVRCIWSRGIFLQEVNALVAVSPPIVCVL